MIEKIAASILAVLVIVSGITIIYAVLDGASANSECRAAGGVYVKAYGGMECVYSISTKRPE